MFFNGVVVSRMHRSFLKNCLLIHDTHTCNQHISYISLISVDIFLYQHTGFQCDRHTALGKILDMIFGLKLEKTTKILLY